MIKIAALLGKIDVFVRLASKLPKVVKEFGPYDRNYGKNDKRQLIILQHATDCDCAGCEDHYKTHPRGKTRQTTQSYPKWIMESRLGRKLEPNETVEHKNWDVLDNSDQNLEVLDRAFHSAQDTRRVKLVDCICQECGKSFQRSPRRLRDKAKRGKKGPFCSKSCAARRARYVQYGKKDKAPCQEAVPSEYYRRKIVERADKLASKWGDAIIKTAAATNALGLQPTLLGCDLCGFGSVENIDEWSPYTPCQECGEVAIVFQ